jgi:hypothetical protein
MVPPSRNRRDCWPAGNSLFSKALPFFAVFRRVQRHRTGNHKLENISDAACAAPEAGAEQFAEQFAG